MPWSSASKAFRFWRMSPATGDLGCVRVTGGASGVGLYNEEMEAFSEACPSPSRIASVCTV